MTSSLESYRLPSDSHFPHEHLNGSDRSSDISVGNFSNWTRKSAFPAISNSKKNTMTEINRAKSRGKSLISNTQPSHKRSSQESRPTQQVTSLTIPATLSILDGVHASPYKLLRSWRTSSGSTKEDSASGSAEEGHDEEGDFFPYPAGNSGITSDARDFTTRFLKAKAEKMESDLTRRRSG